jgi:hypothetical protein
MSQEGENFAMKKIFIVVFTLILAQTACNLPGAFPAQSTSTPSLPAVTVSADTPLAPTTTSAPEITQTSTSTPTAIPTASPTLTETVTPRALFSDIKLSAQVVSPNCEPKSVRFEVTPADPKVYSVVLFIRLHYKTAGDRTNWNDGFTMKPMSGKFIYDLKASAISDFNKFKDPVAWVQFQLVVIDTSGTIIGRSEVFTDKLTISAVCL